MAHSPEALGTIRSLAAAGHSTPYIADALNRARVPAPSGFTEARWHAATVRRLALRHGISVGACVP